MQNIMLSYSAQDRTVQNRARERFETNSRAAKCLKVAVIHPSFQDDNARWIDDFVDPSRGYLFRKVCSPAATRNWHERGELTPLSDWKCHFRQAYTAMRSGSDVVIANFPQLIFAACLLKIILLSRVQILGWSFNFGSAARSRFAALFGQPFRVARFLVVHSRPEISYYAQTFRLPEQILRFAPLQRGRLTVDKTEIQIPKRPYIISMGSAARDYDTLFRAAEKTNLDVLVVAKPEAVSAMEQPANLNVVNGLTLEQCWTLAAHAKVMVLPLADTETAAGQVTFLAALQLGVPLIATDGTGTRDYLRDGETALLVPPGDAVALHKAVSRIEKTPGLSKRLAKNGYIVWEKEYSDEAVAETLADILDQMRR